MKRSKTQGKDEEVYLRHEAERILSDRCRDIMIGINSLIDKILEKSHYSKIVAKGNNDQLKSVNVFVMV